MMGPRACKTIALAIAVLASGCQFPPPPQASTEAELRSLGFSKLCQPNLPVFGRFYYPGDIWPGDYLPPHGSILMSNDGGWCQIGHVFTYRQAVSVGTLSVATPPIHGQVRTGAVGPQLRIAYRPAPGFTGTDGFVVHLNTPEPWDIPVQVTVVP